MKIINELEQIPFLDNAVLTIGFFDGFHLGHRKIFSRLLESARENQAQSLVLTFENHALTIIEPDKKPYYISSLGFKKRFIEANNADYLILLPFTQEFSRITAEDFLIFLKNRFKKLKIIVGENFRFGFKNIGTVQTISDFASASHGDLVLEAVHPVKLDHHRVSSSRIRNLIQNGSMHETQRLLLRNFSVENTVYHGNGLGKKLGFPTANLFLPGWQISPKYGVYYGKTRVENKVYDSMVFISNRKLDEVLTKTIIETHLFGFSGSLYGQKIEVSLVSFIREPIQFTDSQKLKEQIQKDRETILKIMDGEKND
ncbi:MAG TPA: hypothetical protein DHW82_07915 [Spirochaetia bacterium]|nr:MAG: riboflavin biosynthesis protein RibF [Spirochaetes bacterium GWB1_36_13]HCL56918.1 hypothetical protein [Spirochaetia bacterium]